jgi:hypothetical protein
MNYKVDLDQLVKVHKHQRVADAIGVSIATLKALASGQRCLNLDKLADLADTFPEFCITKTVLNLVFKRKRNGRYRGVGYE